MTAKHLSTAILAALTLAGCHQDETHLVGQNDSPIVKAELSIRGDAGTLDIQYGPGTAWPPIHETISVETSPGNFTITRPDKTRLTLLKAAVNLPIYACADCAVLFQNKVPMLWEVQPRK